MRHPGARLLLTSVVVGSGVLALAPTGTATAASTACSVQVRQRVVVNEPTERITARLASDCGRADVAYASWNVVNRAHGTANVFIFGNGRSTDVWRFHDWQYKGRFTLDPSVAYDLAFDSVRQNRARIEVRYAARVSLAARRQGAVVTLRAHATRYTSAGSHFAAIRGRRTFFAARDCRTCAWHRIGAVTTGRFGKAALRVRSPRERDYRAVMRGTTSVWGRTSRIARR